jgi:hypothetical protein
MKASIELEKIDNIENLKIPDSKSVSICSEKV